MTELDPHDDGPPPIAPEDQTPENTRNGNQGEPFTLGDRRRWFLAVPTFWLYPKVVEVPVYEGMPHGPKRESIEVESRWGYPPRLEKLVNKFIEDVYGETAETSLDYRQILEVAYHLLKRCHDVDDQLVAEALSMSASEAETIGAGMLRMFRGLPPFDEPGPAVAETSEDLEHASKD